MREALSSEALLALKAFGDLVLYVIEHTVDDYWETNHELENFVDDLLHNSVVFDDPQSSKSIEFFHAFPVILEVIRFLAERNIPTVVSLRFPYGGGESMDNAEFLKKYAKDKLPESQKNMLFAKLESLRAASEHECFVSAEKEEWLFRILAMLASTAARNYHEQRSKGTNLVSLLTTGDDKKSSPDSDFLLRLKSFLSLPAEKQAHDFPWKVQKTISSYLRAVLNSEIHFPQIVLAWNQQLEWVKSVLAQQSAGHNTFVIDPSCFAARTSNYEKMIAQDRRPVECLLLLEERGDIAFEGMVRMDDEHIVIHLTYLANDFFEKKAERPMVKDAPTKSTLFRFGNSITDCDTHFIWKDGDKEHGSKFHLGAKRRHVWEFCRNHCDQGFKTQDEIDRYVSEKLGRKEHVSVDDMKALLSVIAQFSDVPLKRLRSDFIKFKEGSGIEVKMVP